MGEHKNRARRILTDLETQLQLDTNALCLLKSVNMQLFSNMLAIPALKGQNKSSMCCSAVQIVVEFCPQVDQKPH